MTVFTVSVAVWLALWQAASWLIGQHLILPGPIEVVRACADALASASFWSAVGFSAVRILGGLALAYMLALPAAALAHRSRIVRTLLAPPLAAARATPVVCVVVLLLLWLGAANVSFAAVLLMALPGVYFSMLEGLAHQDGRMVELFEVHGVRGARRALACTWQQALPYVLAATSNVVGMAWKAGVAAELIGVPLGSMGERIYQAKLLLETADVLAWTAAVVAISAVSTRVFTAFLRATGPAAIRLALHLSRTNEGAADSYSDMANGDVTEANGDEGCSDGAGRHGGVAGGRRGSQGKALVELIGAHPTFEMPGLSDLGINLTAHVGERVCLTAASGAGKTTALRLIAGLLKPACGTVNAPTTRAMLFQETRLIEDASALQNVLLFSARDADAEQARSCLAQLIPGIDVNEPVRTLSGGQRRRVELVRTLLAPGDLVLLDEPFSGLDTAAHRQAAAFVLNHLHGRTLITATHTPTDPTLLSARIVPHL